ncbi:nuclear transport factor 2 family protein [Synechococcus sp. PCC 7336]|uniref:nuclear transport factor 2 family protein n=1 Tax=Synechococcus sp. PCC 7336 TaxID=195250 RepID=UPI00034A089D|nr:nuclear transport factor 2 family protein [Synechococcus sp. PCC 7336]
MESDRVETETEALLAANEAFYRAFEKRDMEAMEAVCSQGIGCLCAHPGRLPLQGWQAIGESWRAIFRNTDYLEIDTEIISVEVNGDLGYVVAIEHVMQVAKRQRGKARSLATNIFERMGPNWYLIHHHGSPLL